MHIGSTAPVRGFSLGVELVAICQNTDHAISHFLMTLRVVDAENVELLSRSLDGFIPF
jgi:hypothetical protein